MFAWLGIVALILPVAASIRTTSVFASAPGTYPTRSWPSGDHPPPTVPLNGRVLARLAFDPSAFATTKLISLSLFTTRMNATFEPSGDQVGQYSSARLA